MFLARPTSLQACLAALAALALGGPVAAHAYLDTATPENGSTLEASPAEVVIVLSEAVEVRFSTFKAYPLETDPEMTRRELANAALALMEQVLPLRDDEDARVDTGLRAEGRTTTTVTLDLKEDLPPGTYLVMWKVLSVDSHVGEGFTLFTVAPPDPEAPAEGDSPQDEDPGSSDPGS